MCVDFFPQQMTNCFISLKKHYYFFPPISGSGYSLDTSELCNYVAVSHTVGTIPMGFLSSQSMGDIL